MNSNRRILPLAQMLVRNFGKTCKVPAEKCPKDTPEIVRPKFAKLKATQKAFQIDDGVPVYLKAGRRDKLLYQFSWLLIFVGLGMSVETAYKLITK